MQQVSNATTHTIFGLNARCRAMPKALGLEWLRGKLAWLSKHCKPRWRRQSLALHHKPQTDKKQKSYLKIQVAYGSGSWRIRTADPLLVRQMLWTSWAKLPFVNAWDCKGSYYFLISKLFISFFSKGLVIISKARPHLTYLWYWLFPSANFWPSPHKFGLPPLVCIPRT